MPRIVPEVTKVTAEFQATAKMLAAFRETWLEQLKASGIDDVRYSQLSVVAMTQLAAIVAVDVGVKLEQFTAVCQANFKEAYDKAPKFG